MELGAPFSFTKGCPVMKIDAAPLEAPGVTGDIVSRARFGSLLYDLENDPTQQHPMDDPSAEEEMTAHLVRLMKHNDAPKEQYERLGLSEATPG